MATTPPTGNREFRNELVRLAEAKRFRTQTFRMGFEPSVPWDQALRLAGEPEDEELTRKLAPRK